MLRFGKLAPLLAVCSVAASARATPATSHAPGAASSAPVTLTYPLRPARERDTARAGSGAHAGDNFMARPVAIFENVSIGGPYGFAGASLDISLLRYLALEGGVGMGGGGLEMGAMLRPRIPCSPGFAIGAGVGMSGEYNYKEPFSCIDEGPCTPPTWSFAPFVEGELYAEGRLGMGLSARGYIGWWKLLEPSPDNFRGPSDYLSMPYIGAAFGYAW